MQGGDSGNAGGGGAGGTGGGGVAEEEELPREAAGRVIVFTTGELQGRGDVDL